MKDDILMKTQRVAPPSEFAPESEAEAVREISERGPAVVGVVGTSADLQNQPGLSEDELAKLKKLNEKVLEETGKSVDLLKKLTNNVITVSDDIIQGLTDTRRMYLSIFILGIGLVLAALLFAVLTKTELFPLLFGSAGVLDLLAFFLKDPPQQLQKSRTNFCKLQAAYYQWLTDAANWSVLLYTLSREDKLGIKDMKEASDSYIASFGELMRIIDGGAQDTGTAAK